jgi:hypothetical protein
MKPVLIYSISLLFSLYNLDVSAQDKNIIINGKVISFEESFPLEGVGIVVKGSKNVTGTQSDGSFTLSISPEDKILVISHDGYETQEIKITGSRDYEIVLKRK